MKKGEKEKKEGGNPTGLKVSFSACGQRRRGGGGGGKEKEEKTVTRNWRH